MKKSEAKGRHRQALSVASLVDEVLDGNHLGSEVRKVRIRTEWARIVGPRLAARTVPGEVSDGVLAVRVSNSSWLHQLSFLRDELVVRINEALGHPPLVREIRMHLGKRHEDAPVEPGPTAMRRRRARPRPLPEPAVGHELSAIQAECSRIPDPELRDVIADVRRRLAR